MTNFFKRLFHRQQSVKNPRPPDKPSTPAVMLGPWGGEDAIRLMIKLDPTAFKGARVGVAIEKGYVDTDLYEAPQWVEHNCSGLRYVDHHQTNDTIFITMEIDPSAVDPSSSYPYLISGYGGGEYVVSVFRLKEGKPAECLFERSFCCK